MKNAFKTASIMMAMVAGLAASATAGVIVAEENWDELGDTHGFSLTEEIDSSSTAALSVPDGFGNGDRALRIDSDTTGDNGINTDRITATGGDASGFLGAYNTVRPETITFDFFMNIQPASGLQFLITGNGFTWIYNIDTSSLGLNTWNSITVPMSTDVGWVSPFAPFGTSFLTDVGNVTEVGFRLQYQGETAGQVFGFDNLKRLYNSPEPETYAALSFALICLGITFRRRLQDSMNSAMTMLRS